METVMKTIQSVLRSMARSPLKSILTLLTVGIGVGVLIFALSISDTFSELMEQQLQKEGIVLNIANAEIDEGGNINQIRPPQFEGNALDIIRTEVSGVTAITPLSNPFWNEFTAKGTTYRVRTVVSANEEYGEVMGMELISGSFFTAQDVEAGAKVAVITESLAKILFGTVEAAQGSSIRPPARDLPDAVNRNAQARSRMAIFTNPPSFEVIGVVKDPGELQRKSYRVADMVIPYTAAIPPGVNSNQFMRFLSSRSIVKIAGISRETAEAQIRDVLTRAYGDDVAIQIWEGTPTGESEYLEEIRQTVSTFSIIVNLLGFILLAAASIGILSIMLVEALGRTREIALERALGASKRLILREFFTRSVVVSFMSAIIGVVLALVLANPLKSLIIPIFAGVSLTDISGSVISGSAVLIGSLSALIIGGVFGVFPVFTVIQTGISEALREA